MSVLPSTLRGKLSLLGRVTYGSILLSMALNGFTNTDEQVEYAASKGVPMPDTLVPLSHGLLLFGSLGVILGVFRRLSVGAIALFFVGVTPMMHDFWAVEDEDQRQTQMIHFMKNTALLGAALSFLIGRKRVEPADDA